MFFSFFLCFFSTIARSSLFHCLVGVWVLIVSLLSLLLSSPLLSPSLMLPHRRCTHQQTRHVDQTQYGPTVTPQCLHLHHVVFLTPPLPPEYRVVATVRKQARAIIVQRKRIHRRLLPHNNAHQRVSFRLAVPSPNLDATIRGCRVYCAVTVNNLSMDGVLIHKHIRIRLFTIAAFINQQHLRMRLNSCLLLCWT